MGAKYRTCILELTRNSGKPEMESKLTDKYLMLDYFDILQYRELIEDQTLDDNRKMYMYYFAINDVFAGNEQCKTSRRILSLYQHVGDGKKEENPFVINEVEGEYLSDTPFLGLIQIYLCRESFIDEHLDGEDGNVDLFLRKMEDKIRERVYRILKTDQTDSPAFLNSKELGGTMVDIYRSSTSGDFCLVMRTDSIAKIYNVAFLLNHAQNDPKEPLHLLTYTNVGVECKRKKDGSGYCTFNPSFVAKSQESTIELRLSGDSTILQVAQKSVENIEWCKGILGRYDYLLHMSLDTFSELYPQLCREKFGKPVEDSFKGWSGSQVFEPRRTAAGGNFVGNLSELLSSVHVHDIHERILVNADKLMERDSPLREEDMTSNRENARRNDILQKEIKGLGNYRERFSEESRTFQDLYRATKELFWAYAATHWEKDAELNWYIWYQDMKVLCKCIQEKMIDYHKLTEDKQRKLRRNLLANWRENIQAINKYTRLVQNVNYQSYQSPISIYEMQTQIDAEKVMVAYREMMRIYLRYFEEYAKNKLNWSDQETIEPVIYPDLTQQKITVKTLFADTLGGILPCKKTSVCTVPSFEYFGRLYDFLPQLVHEASHPIRILEGEIRNRFIIDYAVKHVSDLVVKKILQEFSLTDGCMGIQVEASLLKSFRDVTVDKILHKLGSDISNPDFETTANAIGLYLLELFPDNDDGTWNFEKAKNALVQALLEEIRKEDFGGNKAQDAWLEELKMLKIGKRDKARAEKLIKALLDIKGEKMLTLLCRKGVSEESAKSFLIPITNFSLPPKIFECEINNLDKIMEEGTDITPILKEYVFWAKKIYWVFYAYQMASEENASAEDEKRSFLQAVFDHYQKHQVEFKRGRGGVFQRDPGVMYFLNQAGLLKDDARIFCDQCLKVFHKISGSQIQKCKKFSTQLYRETCADLMMAASLQMNSFGYCRLVLRVKSDSQTSYPTSYPAESFNNVDYNRFRMIAALLLVQEGVEIEEYSDEEYRIDGSRLIQQGKLYCESLLKHIRQTIFADQELNPSASESETLESFLGDINKQIQEELNNLSLEGYQKTLLYLFLHEKRMISDMKCLEGNDADETVTFEMAVDKYTIDRWKKYRGTVERYIKYKQHFCRLECFCLGINMILKNNYIIVERDFFKHMNTIWEKIHNPNGNGCVWEQKMWKCMCESKRDVGDFYNDPESIFKKAPGGMLENTIDFIQNFYYHNRAGITREWETNNAEKRAKSNY